MKMEIAAHLDVGYLLRDRAYTVKTDEEALAWKDEEKQWAESLYRLVAQIDPADVILVKNVGVIDCPVSHELQDGHPLKVDPEQSLDIHNTRIVRLVPDYLKSLPRRRAPKHGFKDAVPTAVARYLKDNPNAKKTQLSRDIAEDLDCDESTVRKIVRDLQLLD